MSFTDNPLVYKFAACSPLEMQCSGTSGLMALAVPFNNPNQCIYPYGTNAATSVTLLGSKAEGVQLQFKGGTCSSDPKVTATTTLDIQCDAGGGGAPHAQQLLSSSDDCGFHIQFKSSAGCPIQLEPEEVISPAAIALIVVASLAVVYLGGGFAYNSCARGASGIEAVPNIDFWRACCGRVGGCCGCSPAPTAQAGFYTDMTVGEGGAMVGGDVPFEDEAGGHP